MKLSKIKVKNYKSLKDVTITFDNLTIFVGKNNSGKSNIFDIFKFIKESNEDGLPNAYQNRGGFQEVIFSKDLDNKFEWEIILNVPEDRRRNLIDQWSSNFGLEKVQMLINSNFLKTITYYGSFGRHKYNERIEASNTVDGDFVIRRLDSEGGNYKLSQNNLKQAVEKMKENENISQEMQETSSGSGSGRLLLNQGGRSIPPSPREIINDLLIEELVNKFTAIDPIRKSDVHRESSGIDTLDSEGKNLINYLLALRNRYPNEFQEIVENIQSIIPEIKNVLTPISGNTATIAIDEGNFPSFTLNNVSSGIRQALIIITKVATAPKGSIVCIEEPENQFHPSAQRYLFNFLKNQSKNKTILITTHSSVIAGMANYNNLKLVRKEIDGSTVLEPLNEDSINKVIDELGIKPSDIFENDAIIFVDGESDEGIYAEFSKTLIKDNKLCYIATEGWTSTSYYANAKILSSKRVNFPTFVIFDGDTSRSEKNNMQKEKLMNQLNIDKDNIISLNKNSIEDYLLVPKAIKRAFNDLKPNEKEIEDILQQNSSKKNKKYVLDSLFKEGGLGKYHEKDGIKIAKVMFEDEIDNEIKEILNTIKKKTME